MTDFASLEWYDDPANPWEARIQPALVRRGYDIHVFRGLISLSPNHYGGDFYRRTLRGARRCAARILREENAALHRRAEVVS